MEQQTYTWWQRLTMQNVSAGLLSFTLVMTGPVLLTLQAAQAGHFSSEQTISWIFAVYVFGGLFGIIMPLRYKIPITGGNSISGVAFLATVTAHFTYPQLLGGYVLSSLIILLIGVSGLFTKMIHWVPKEVIAAMLAGLVTKYVTQFIVSVQTLPIVGGAALLSYFISSKISKRIPAVIVAVGVAFITLLLTEPIHAVTPHLAFTLPTFHWPEWTWLGTLTLALPLAMLILSNDVVTGIGALESAKFTPPIRKLVSFTGLFSLMANLFGGQSANLAGMMTAICSNSDVGARANRYMASVVSGTLTLLFGIFAWRIVPFIESLPLSFVSILAGLSLIGVLLSSFQKGFASGNYRISALFAFVIALSNVSVLHISAPVWGLLVGALIAKTVEQQSFS